MKRLRNYLLLALLTLVGNANADQLKVADFTVSPGETYDLAVELENPDCQYIMTEFWMTLPAGVSIAKDEDDEYLYEESSRFDKTHSLTISAEEGNVYHFLIYSSKNKAFKDNSGILFTITLKAAENATNGQYQCKIFNQIFSDTDKNEHNPADVPFNVIIGSSAGVDVVLDETNTEVPEATAGDVTILVKRTIKANEWSTICLPFDMTEAQTKEAFGNGVQLKEFTDYEVEYDTDDNVVGLTVNFDDTDLSEGFYGNYPYLIKVENDIDEFTITSTIEPVEDDCYQEYDNGRTGKNRKVYGTFKGFYHAQTTVPNNCLFLSGNKFWYSTGQTKMKAFRAYFDFVDVLDNLENANARISMSFDDETTRIVNVNVNDDENYYDLQGRRVAHPQKGLYIKNNKKVVVK